MATKRMFTNEIVGSDAFLEMPSTSQALYFHLGMRSDDDGFVNPNVTMRMTGSNKNDLDVLIAKRFVIQFKNGVLVIKHHRMNNNWDSRDCKRTVYTEELSQLYIKENKAYTLDESKGIPIEKGYRNTLNIGTRREPDGLPAVEEKRREENRRDKKSIYTSSFETFWKLYPKKVGKPKSFEFWKKMTEADHKAIMVDIPKRLVEDDKWINGFIKDPERYLKNRQWEDDIIKPRGKIEPQRRVDSFVKK